MPISPAKAEDLVMYQGVSRVITVTVEGTAPNDANEVKWVLVNSAGAVVLSKTDDSVNINNKTSTTYDVNIFPSDTATLNPGKYTHETRITDGDDQEDVTTTGNIELKKSYTN